MCHFWQVISPEDAGNGFAEVGALGPVKDVLREVVQFPLQYPDLFAQGSLATLSRGVLLFGPPGRCSTASCQSSLPSVCMSSRQTCTDEFSWVMSCIVTKSYVLISHHFTLHFTLLTIS